MGKYRIWSWSVIWRRQSRPFDEALVPLVARRWDEDTSDSSVQRHGTVKVNHHLLNVETHTHENGNDLSVLERREQCYEVKAYARETRSSMAGRVGLSGPARSQSPGPVRRAWRASQASAPGFHTVCADRGGLEQIFGVEMRDCESKKEGERFWHVGLCKGASRGLVLTEKMCSP